MRYLRFGLIVLGSTLLCLPVSFGQYFGKNKPRYTNFDFKVTNSPHFEVYSYLRKKDEVEKLIQWSEIWYDHHEHILNDTFNHHNPLVFYNNHADFQQILANMAPEVRNSSRSSVVIPRPEFDVMAMSISSGSIGLH